ncbi:DUF2797 domain-containing protein [Flavobacteriaceae bacterium]|nr:DUF2797 domain-containing protein [Flavobacteriaceae bacterium]MDB4152382.1 DUF2797 domain-containing protein [Flavobacteriaceae bacterium]MDB9988653.1 DUF2797 domain-containing protein [Flavobacteriaceae bacterium]MDO7569175.1 DUF2797 domain-containing protein [Flavobacteriaceae bacterium]
MNTAFGPSVGYYLNLKDDFVALHQFIDQSITLEMIGYECLNCSRTEPIFRQGFCKKCFFESPNAGDWIMRPELSTAHLDIEDRDLVYEKKVQLQPHIVYLALSSHLKVGVTRKTQVPTRWIDQGAHQALAVLEVPNRYLAGVGEVALKEIYSDKTNWRKMLQNEAEPIDWVSERNKAIDHLPKELKPYVLHENTEPLAIEFPVNRYPEKVKSLNLIKEQNYTAVLKGIKGQYLIFEDDTVFNVRSNEGLVVNLSLH